VSLQTRGSSSHFIAAVSSHELQRAGASDRATLRRMIDTPRRGRANPAESAPGFAA
jgi:hypothetical protein